jgi:hypothetical protein
MEAEPFDWDAYRSADFPQRVKFEQPGTSVSGVVVAVVSTDFGGITEPMPELHIERDDGRVVSVVATQARLITQLAEKRPEVGDSITITFTRLGTPKRPGFNPPKFFTVEVARAEDNAVDNDDQEQLDLDPDNLI